MLFLLSPAKTLDYDTPVPLTVARKATDPLFTAQAKDLVAVLRKLTTAQVSELMALSDALAALNVGRYQAWQPQATPDNSKPAVLAFNGDVYDGLDARTLKLPDLTWAQEHLVILSGLYGALRPLDRLQPYRLEMGTALKTRRGKDLYAYWGDTVTHYLNERLTGESKPIVVNLASQEYAKVALRPALQAVWWTANSKTGKAIDTRSSASLPSEPVASWPVGRCSTASSRCRNCRLLMQTVTPSTPRSPPVTV